ncbi:UDP-N-acetylmuramoyl-tripeptide--D-alanyl-D-alanine ligase [Candidatus Saccharibacteria bacterium]|nr:UDP-N-acetylmuramoyl-tripeptide--D-alanyl-D-alanine ligase [Candidatus Saccharibacteria bacterium]
MLKKYLKEIIVFLEYRYVRKLLESDSVPKIVAVSGSVGKTSTKRAIAILLSEKYKVGWQDGNYNDIVSVPLVFFGQKMPSLFNPIAWAGTLVKFRKSIKDYPYKVVVLELGTDAPGQIDAFKKYFKIDVAVVTPIAPEHMEFFDSIDEVAREELSIINFSRDVLIHESVEEYKEFISKKYTKYGEGKFNDSYTAGEEESFVQTKKERYRINSDLLGRHQKVNLSAACLVAEKFDLSKTQIEEGLSKITPMPGRMQQLKGIRSSTIIDDTYNSSPEATIAALATLKLFNSDHKIAVLGNMNELGEISAKLHRDIGKLCQPNFIDLVITIGPDANKYLAKAAADNGCEVITSKNPYEISEILSQKIKKNAVVLLKGSQNKVFLEEAIKGILADPNDESKLVRQSKYWLKKKKAMFK